MAEKTEKPEKPEPAPDTEAKSFGESLAEMGFLPVNLPRRIILRRDRPSNPLRLWNAGKSKGQD